MSESWESQWQQAILARGFDPPTPDEFQAYRGTLLPFDAVLGLMFGGPGIVWDQRAGYDVIGCDRLYNSVGVEEGTGAVWLLDWTGTLLDHLHGTPAKPVMHYPPGWGDGPPLHRQFINSGVPELAESLLVYVQLRDPERIGRAIATIDPSALAEGAFWWKEVPAAKEEFSERLIRECVMTMSLVIPETAWPRYVAQVRHMAASGINLWDAAEACAFAIQKAEPNASPDINRTNRNPPKEPRTN